MSMTSTSTTQSTGDSFPMLAAFAKLRCINCGELTYYDGKEDDLADLRHVAGTNPNDPSNATIFCDWRNPASPLAERP